MRAFRYATLAIGLGITALCLADCSGPSVSKALSPADCAAPIVARYTERMIVAGCHGEHFNDPQCATIKAERDADEEKAGCK